MKNPIYANFINRRTGQQYTVKPETSRINLRTDIFKFCNIFDFIVPIGRNEDPELQSHDFVEFFIDIDGTPFQIGAGYLENFSDSISATSSTMQANGKSLLGQLMNVIFKTTLYHEAMEMGSLVNLAAKGEYLETYNKLKGRAGMIIDQKYNRSTFLAVSDLTQKKGQILESYARMGNSLICEDRLGRVLLLGSDYVKPPVSGRLIYSKNKTNVTSLSRQNSFSEAYSHATIMYTQTENKLEANALANRMYVNDDPRVKDIISNQFYETFNVSDIAHFAGGITAEARMDQIARSTIRRSNTKINQIVLTSDDPYYVDPVTKKKIPFEQGQLWEIESDIRKLKSKKFPEGTNLIEMVLTGIDYQQTEDSFEVQLQFSDPDYLV